MPLGAELAGLESVGRGVGVGAHLHRAVLVGPPHDPAEVAADLGRDRVDLLAVDVAGGTVEGDPVVLGETVPTEAEALAVRGEGDVAEAGHAAGAHAAGDHGRVGGHAAARGEDAVGVVHALDVLGGGLQANQDDGFAGLAAGGGVLGGEGDLAGGRTRGRREALADRDGGRQLVEVELRVQQGVDLLGVDHRDGPLRADHALVHQIAGDLEGGGGGPLAVAGLEHEELALFDGELHVLHVGVVALELGDDLDELVVHRRVLVAQLVDGLRGTDAGHDVLTLGVHQELAVQALVARGGVAGEGHAGAGGRRPCCRTPSPAR